MEQESSLLLCCSPRGHMVRRTPSTNPQFEKDTKETKNWTEPAEGGAGLDAASPSSVMVPLLEPPLLLERGWEEAEDRESPGPVGGLGVGEGEGVRVGDVLLEVEEFPDWGLFFNSIFYRETEKDRSIRLRHGPEGRPGQFCLHTPSWGGCLRRPGWGGSGCQEG